MKRLFSLLLVAVLCLSFASCKKDNSKDDAKAKTSSTQKTTESTKKLASYCNPLTGESNFDKKLIGKKPYAVMINNISIAQGVQTGIGDADMVFETEVEGGITRLMAVYSDISKVDQIGSVRSARISYAQLASGLDAYYIHCGADNKYCGSSYRSSLGLYSLDLGSNASSVGKRISNGLATEHTLYTFGSSVSNLVKDKDNNIKESAKNVYKFNKENKAEKFENEAKNVVVKLSSIQTNHFRYNSDKKQYARGNSSGDFKDYKTGKTEDFKNLFVLYTNVHSLSDGYHMKTEFGSGEGYYFSEGSYKTIKWEKTSETSPLKFFDNDGKDLKINVGNSYICLADTDYKSSLSIESF